MSGLCVVMFAICSANILVAGQTLVSWRYTNLRGHSGTATTRDILKLEALLTTEGTESSLIVWTAPTCALSHPTGMAVYLKCAEEGVHSVTLTIEGYGSKKRDIRFFSTSECYNWYLHIAPHTRDHDSSISKSETRAKDEDGSLEPRPTDHQMLKVWIIDYLQASSEERNNVATQPSPDSRLLSFEYHTLGQRPSVQMESRLGSAIIRRDAVLLQFNETEGYWIFIVKISDRDHSLSRSPSYTISGMSVALYDCFVKDRKVLFPSVKFPLLSTITPRYYMIGRNTMSLSLVSDPCRGNIALALVREKLYITQDDFSTITLLPAPEGFTSHLNVSSITLMYNYIVVLSNTSKIYSLRVNDSTFRPYQAPKNFRPTIISSQDWCVDGSYADINLDLLTMSDGQQVWVSNNLQPATKLQLPESSMAELAFEESYSYEVHDVSIDIQPGRIGVAIKLTINQQSKVIFAIHDIFQNSWWLAPFWVDFKVLNAGKISFYFLGLAKSSFYFRNQQSLFFSYDDSASYGIKRLYGCTNITEVAASPDHIRDIIVSRQGDISILLSTNQILFGKVKHGELVLFDAFHRPGDLNTVHWFDQFNQLWFITVHNDNTVERLLYPLKEELQSSLGQHKSCVYRYFLFNIEEKVYQLDKQETLTFWAFLVFRQEQHNTIDILFSEPDSVIEYTTKLEKKYMAGVASENLTISFSNRMGVSSPSHGEFYAVGVDILELRPHRSNLLCEAPNSAIAYVLVGCPSGRHIRVRHAQGKECTNASKLYPREYVIKAGHWINLTTGEMQSTDQVVHLKPDGLGCPAKIDVDEAFKPVLELYDYDIFVKVVDADFIIWEINGRSDYSYTHNIEEIGCLREAQTWNEMRQQGNYTLPVEHLWGPHNYKSCFLQEPGDYFNEHVHELKYEILNHSSPNRILFTRDYDSLLVFGVKVVDPTYSFCSLSAMFAVRITGFVPPTDLKEIAAANYAVLAAIVITLLVTYIWFHTKTVKKQKQAMEKYELSTKSGLIHANPSGT